METLVKKPPMGALSPKPKSKEKREKSYHLFKTEDRARDVALYYGFMPVGSALPITKEDTQKAKGLIEGELKARSEGLAVSPEEKVAVMMHCFNKNLIDETRPAMLYFEGFAGNAGKRKSPKERRADLEIIGTGKSIAEAILIQTSLAILREEGYKNLFVEINSVGDKESLARFTKELGNHYRKNLHLLAPQCKTAARKDVFEAYSCGLDKCKTVRDSAPKSVSFLSEQSRNHFTEVLEFLEELGVPYRMAHFLVGHRSLCTETLFEIRDGKEGEAGELLGIGCRYNSLAKKLGFKRDVPSVGVHLSYRRISNEVRRPVKIKRPSIYFLQLGNEAKRKSLIVIEILRQAKIPIYQSLPSDKLVAQIGNAENLRIPYSIIMGQKEAMENSVIVRNSSTRAQETVKIGVLPEYLKKLKM